ncbi:MAG: hypothetical protein AAGF73_06320 [Actinomycetota bacterium]
MTAKRLVPLGLLVTLAGLTLGGVLWWMANERADDGVDVLARAPVGCDTTLDFDQVGEYLVFVETSGQFDDVPGDCNGPSGSFDVSERPDVSVAMFDPDGEQIDIEEATGITYERLGRRGEQIGAITVSTAGDYVLRVESGTELNVAVGGDPGQWVSLIRLSAVLVAIIGLIGGGALLLRATRQPEAEPVDAEPWLPGGGPWPQQPPGAPAPPPTTGAAGVARPVPRTQSDAPARPPAAIPGEPDLPGAPQAPSPWAPPDQAP